MASKIPPAVESADLTPIHPEWKPILLALTEASKKGMEQWYYQNSLDFVTWSEIKTYSRGFLTLKILDVLQKQRVDIKQFISFLETYQ